MPTKKATPKAKPPVPTRSKSASRPKPKAKASPKKTPEKAPPKKIKSLKTNRGRVLFSIDLDSTSPKSSLKVTGKLTKAKARKIAEDNYWKQRKRAASIAYTEMMNIPVVVPKKVKPGVVVCTQPRQDPLDKKAALDFGWVDKKNYLPMPHVGDAVKVAIFSKGKFIENVHLRVTRVKESGYILARVGDEMFWPKQSGLHRNMKVKIRRRNILKLVTGPKWVEGRYYESQAKEILDKQETTALAPEPSEVK